MHYKRKAHRGRGKRNTMDNNNMRFLGNSQSKSWDKRSHQSKTQRNRVMVGDLE